MSQIAWQIRFHTCCGRPILLSSRVGVMSSSRMHTREHNATHRACLAWIQSPRRVRQQRHLRSHPSQLPTPLVACSAYSRAALITGNEYLLRVSRLAVPFPIVAAIVPFPTAERGRGAGSQMSRWITFLHMHRTQAWQSPFWPRSAPEFCEDRF